MSEYFYSQERGNGDFAPLTADIAGLRATASDEDLARIKAAYATEKPRAIAAFESYLHTLPAQVTLDEVLATAKAVEDEISPDYPYTGIQSFLLQYYGAELLPHIVPDAKRLHVALDGTKEDSIVPPVSESYTAHGFPDALHSVPLTDICRTIGSTVLERGRNTTDRIDRVDGMCGVISSECLYSIAAQYPQSKALIGSRVEVRLEGMPSRRLLPNESGNYLRLLGIGHSLFGLKYHSESGEPMVLSIDPTIAQVDQTQAYDIELAAVPRTDYGTFLKLRYRSRYDIAPIYYGGDVLD